MVLLGGVGEALILKWIGGKLVAPTATHLATASGAASTHFAMHAANATLAAANTAAATGGAGAAATTLYHGARANYKLMKKVEKKRGRLARDAAHMSEEEVQAALLDHAIRAIAEGFYENLRKEKAEGGYKTKMEEIQPCKAGDCACPDYDDTLDECLCGHPSHQHGRVSAAEVAAGAPRVFEWAAAGRGRGGVPLVREPQREGQLKDELWQTDACNAEDCWCFNFDLCEENRFISRRCRCGHRYREHTVTGRWERIVLLMAQQSLQEMAEDGPSDESSSSSSSSSSDSESSFENTSDDDGADDMLQLDDFDLADDSD